MQTLGVVQFPDGWKLVSRGRRWGRFWARADAEAAAGRLAEGARAQGQSLQVLCQQPWGEMTELRQAYPPLEADGPSNSAPFRSGG